MIVTARPDTPSMIAQNPPLTMVSGQNERMAGSVPVWDSVTSFAENLAQSGEEGGKNAFSSSFGFSDIIDIVNPLQHIPVVSNLYQSATGDTIGAIAQIVGGAIFGGPIGAVASMATVAYQSAKSTSGDFVPQLGASSVSLSDVRAGYTPYNS